MQGGRSPGPGLVTPAVEGVLTCFRLENQTFVMVKRNYITVMCSLLEAPAQNCRLQTPNMSWLIDYIWCKRAEKRVNEILGEIIPLRIRVSREVFFCVRGPLYEENFH